MSKRKKGEPEKLQSLVEQHPVALTDKELLSFGQRLAQTDQQLYDHAETTKSVKKDLASKEASIVAERSRLALIVRNKAESRDVQVSVYRDMSSKTLFHVREDTGEETFRRHLRNEELQVDAFEAREDEGDDEPTPPNAA